METMYERIRRLRKSIDMTQTELAVLMGYSDKSMIAKIEAGKVKELKLILKADVKGSLEVLENMLEELSTMLDSLVRNIKSSKTREAALRP